MIRRLSYWMFLLLLAMWMMMMINHNSIVTMAFTIPAVKPLTTLTSQPTIIQHQHHYYTREYLSRRRSLLLYDNAEKEKEEQIKEWESMSIDDLLHLLDDKHLNDISPELRQIIGRKVQENAPTDNEVRMKALGINPVVIAGFALAAILLGLNTLWGEGWATKRFLSDPANREGSVEGIVYKDAQQREEILKLRGNTKLDLEKAYRQILQERSTAQ